MRQLIERHRRELEDFIEQRDDLILVAAAAPEESATLLALLRGLEQSNASDVFLLFSDDFVETAPFVSVALERLRLDHRLAGDALVQEGRPPLPPIPDSLFDSRRDPVQRLKEGIGFARSLLPPGGGHRLVWAMFPQAVADRSAWLSLVRALAPSRGFEPWMRGVRLIFRDDPDPAGPAMLEGAPRLRLQRFDLGPAAIENALRADAEDESAPTDQRMNSLFLLASLDSAHSRFQDAAARYTLLLGHYQAAGDLAMQTYVITGLGDVCRRTGDLDAAQHWYECAIEPATGSRQPAVLAAVVRNLAELAYDSRRYADAEQYFDGWDKLAAECLDPDSKAQALEKRGLCQYHQGAVPQAVESWEAAAALCRNLAMPSRLRSNLAHLAQAYSALGFTEKAAAADAELRSIAALEDPR